MPSVSYGSGAYKRDNGNFPYFTETLFGASPL